MNTNYETGYVYFIKAGSDPAVKIGNTIHSLQERILALQTSNHKELKLIGAIDIRQESGQEGLNRVEYSVLANKREREIHKLFMEDKIRGEWFKYSKKLEEYIFRFCNVDVSRTG